MSANPVSSVGANGASAFAGGTYAPTSGNPTAAGGTFNSVASPGFPQPNAGIVASARNFPQANARIPYARCVYPCPFLRT